MLSSAFKGRLPVSEWYPAREPGLTARRLDLPAGEWARVVEGGPADGPPVVFIHGWGCSAYFFRKLLPAVMGSRRRVIALDLRGHGASSKPADPMRYTAEAMRDFAISVLDTMELARVDVVAHSLGGGITLDLAAAQPTRVRTVTLLAPVGLAPVRFVTLARLGTPPLAAPLVPYAVPRWSIPLVLRAVYGEDGKHGVRDVDEYWAPTADPAFALSLRALLHHYHFAPRTEEEIGRITAPVLLLLGGRDLLVRSRASRVRAERWPGWTVRTMEAAGHVLAEEVPELVLASLLPHLEAAG